VGATLLGALFWAGNPILIYSGLKDEPPTILMVVDLWSSRTADRFVSAPALATRRLLDPKGIRASKRDTRRG
jgi:hypothetical protein